MKYIDVILMLSENGDVEGVTTYSTNPDKIKGVTISIPSNHDVIRFPTYYKYIDGEFIYKQEEQLEETKKNKDRELYESCQQSILKGFYHEIDGKNYHFSYDMQAQSNFSDANQLFTTGKLENIKWTASYKGEYVRIVIDRATMSGITYTILKHKGQNIAKYRDVLLPKVKVAKTIEEVEAITWDSIGLEGIEW